MHLYQSINQGGTRTRNFRMPTNFRSPTPYPLGHMVCFSMEEFKGSERNLNVKIEIQIFSIELYMRVCKIVLLVFVWGTGIDLEMMDITVNVVHLGPSYLPAEASRAQPHINWI